MSCNDGSLGKALMEFGAFPGPVAEALDRAINDSGVDGDGTCTTAPGSGASVSASNLPIAQLPLASGNVVLVSQDGSTLSRATLTSVLESSRVAVAAEGSVLTTGLSYLNFVGDGVSSTASGGLVTVNVPGLNNLAVADEGMQVSSAASMFNFTGAGVAVSAVGSMVNVSVPGASSVAVADEGMPISTQLGTLNFTGPGVTASASGGVVTVNVPGATAAPVLLSATTRTASFTPTVAEGFNYYRFDSSSPGSCTIPTAASQAFAIGFSFALRQQGSGKLTVSPASGVVINGVSGYTYSAASQGSTLALVKVDADIWDIVGDLEVAV